MNETKNSEEKTLSASTRKPITLKRKETGTVRQSFSHGRSKTVVVEIKKPRKMVTSRGVGREEDVFHEPAPKAPPVPAVAPEAEAASPPPVGIVLRELTEEEIAARSKALEESKIAEAEARVRAREEAKQRAEEEKRRSAEAGGAAQRLTEEEARRARELEERQKAEEAAARLLEAEQKAKGEEKPTKARAKDLAEEEEGEKPRRARRGDDERPATNRRSERKRRDSKLTITRALFDDGDERVRSLASVRRARERERRAAQARALDQQKIFREVVIPETITIEELANRMTERVTDVIRRLMEDGQLLTKNDVLDADTAQIIAEEFGHAVKRVAEADVEAGLRGGEDSPDSLAPRPPVVTVMGHVDHGKTSLLDALRATDVAGGEAGGITQHIGAYQVTLASGQRITFLDTPGHAAFTAMRARGAQVTDIVVLVVAADDGVMPQTVEAIAHAREAGVPLIVAINKIDKGNANPDRVRQDLLKYEIVTEKLGGDILDIEVSATKKINLDKLEEAILLQAEILELKANPHRPADGIVIEAKLDKGRGSVATALIERGTLRVGDIIVAGRVWGRIRALIDDRGTSVSEAGPTVPVEVLGLSGTPDPGDEFAVVDSEARARQIAEYRQRKAKEKEVVAKSRGSLEQMMSEIGQAALKELPVVIKADVQGSAEAITQALQKLSTDEVAVRVVHAGVGGITESDVVLASASHAPIIGFNVRANKQAREHAARDGIEIRYYSVIYDVLDDIKGALSGMLAPTLRETFLGNAEILEIFSVSKVGKVAGCRVTEGKVKRGAKVRLIRDSVVIHQGTLSTLKRFKDEVREVEVGQECGMAFANYQDIQVGDLIECFEVEEVARTL